MGVDFFPCDYCEDTICDAGSYKRCTGEDCGRRWCNSECAKKDGYDKDDDSCFYCRNEKFTDYELAEFLLGHFKLTRQEAEDLYRSFIKDLSGDE